MGNNIVITNHIRTLSELLNMFEIEGERGRKNAPNCYFPIQCGSKMNMYSVKKEAINEVNNSDNSGKHKMIEIRSSHHANAFHG